MVDRYRGSISLDRHRYSLWVDSSALVGDISNVAIVGVSLVGHGLGAAVREGHGVGAFSIASTVTALTSVEPGVGVVVRDGVVVGVGEDLVSVDGGGLVGGGHHGGVVGGGYHWGVVGGNHGGVVGGNYSGGRQSQAGGKTEDDLGKKGIV